MAASHQKQSQQLARQLFKLSLVDGLVSPEQVTGVLAYLEKHPPAHPLPVLRFYQRFIATELARSNALVEHASAAAEGLLRTIAGALTRKYQRPITATARPNARLIAGVRIRVGDDVYESSVAAQMANLTAV
jgi:F-type H+-transporting ATPase subunit delta